MVKCIIASRLSFTKGASPMEFTIHYDKAVVGVVRRVARTGNRQWEVMDETQYFGSTREEAASKYLAADLSVAVEPLKVSVGIPVKVCYSG
jgi:hypothetical protein